MNCPALGDLPGDGPSPRTHRISLNERLETQGDVVGDRQAIQLTVQPVDLSFSAPLVSSRSQ
jgi:hypothetical protein